jgi:hypothetical protein
VVDLLRQIEAGEREAEAYALGVVSHGVGSRALSGKPCVLGGFLPLLDSIHKSKIDAVSQLLALLAWLRRKVRR